MAVDMHTHTRTRKNPAGAGLYHAMLLCRCRDRCLGYQLQWLLLGVFTFLVAHVQVGKKVGAGGWGGGGSQMCRDTHTTNCTAHTTLPFIDSHACLTGQNAP
jgi:hypothetical protein